MAGSGRVYQYIINALESEPNIDLSMNPMDYDFKPYMVVAKLKYPDKHHSVMIAKRLPIWRWEHLYPSDCKISKEYSQSVIQIPCHQQLTQNDLAVLVAGIRDSLRVA